MFCADAHSTALQGTHKENFLQGVCLALLPLLSFCAISLMQFDLPGLYMDAVNPDYQAIWHMRGSNHIPAWLYPDNVIAGPYRFPLLNSLYGGNVTAYAGLIYFNLVGYGLDEVRFFHALLGLSTLASLFWCLRKWKFSNLYAAVALCLLAVDPTFFLAWRTQHYLQLIPMIFCSLGLGLLGIHYHSLQSGCQRHGILLGSGILLGFAAYSYFLYAFYSAIIVTLYAFHARQYMAAKIIFLSLAFGTLLGWSPYVYAHISIIWNTSLDAYLGEIKGLQTAYGVIDQSQGGIGERIGAVLERLYMLVGGTEIQRLVFGNWTNNVPAYVGNIMALIIIQSIYLKYFVLPKSLSASPDESVVHKQSHLFFYIINGLVAVHVLVGLIIGRPFGLQHYVMLLPMFYLTATAGMAKLYEVAKANKRYKAVGLCLTFIVGTTVTASNLGFSGAVLARLKETGGVAAFSDLINTAASEIEILDPETILLFPQWGYWMGVVTIVGPSFTAYEASSLADLQFKFNHEAGLQKGKHFAMVVGTDDLRGGEKAAVERMERFAAGSKLRIDGIKTFTSRNKKDQMWLLKLSRSS